MSRMAGVTVILLVALIGAIAGSVIGGWIADNRVHEVEAKATANLRLHSQGLVVGEQFPDFPVWSQDRSKATYISELLPSGGLLVLLDGTCPSCAAEAARVERALHDHADGGCPAILVADGPVSSSVTMAPQREGLTLPVYSDLPGFLRETCGIVTRTAYFVVDSQGTLKLMEGWKADLDKADHVLAACQG
ncbi:MAG: hypothetical protein Kow0074_18440 [Candidatus Zixiibacteriota bacterium]